MNDFGDDTKSYQSRSGYRMWGGTPRPANDAMTLSWISFALVVGIAVAFGAWFALSR